MRKAENLVAKGGNGCFVLALREGKDEHILTAQRGGTRQFKTLQAVASYLKDLGAHNFSVEIDDWAPKSWKT